MIAYQRWSSKLVAKDVVGVRQQYSSTMVFARVHCWWVESLKTLEIWRVGLF